MASKKSGGAGKNGRDSCGKRLGVKRHGGQAVNFLGQYLAALEQAAPDDYLAETLAYLQTVKEIPTPDAVKMHGD